MGLFSHLIKMMMGGGHHGRGYYGGHHGGHHDSHHYYPERGGYGYGYPAAPIAAGMAGMAAAGNVCPKCGTANKPDARFCQGCGSSLGGGKCTSCGADMAPGAQFCSQCGVQP